MSPACPTHDTNPTDSMLLDCLSLLVRPHEPRADHGRGLLAFLARFTTLRFRRDTACTGDLCLNGRVLPVGSLREKLSGAEEMGMTRAVVPWGNFEDEEVLEFRRKYEKNESGLEVVAADNLVELINQCVEEGHGTSPREPELVRYALF